MCVLKSSFQALGLAFFSCLFCFGVLGFFMSMVFFHVSEMPRARLVGL